MPNTRRNPPSPQLLRLPYPDPNSLESDPSQRLLSDCFSDVHLQSQTRSWTPYGPCQPEPWRVPSPEMIDSRTSSGGFGGSLFSTVGTMSTGTTTAAGEEEEEDVTVGPAGANGSSSWARKARESYYLQLSLATRVTWQAYMGEDRAGLVVQEAADSSTASYRLWR